MKRAPWHTKGEVCAASNEDHILVDLLLFVEGYEC